MMKVARRFERGPQFVWTGNLRSLRTICSVPLAIGILLLCFDVSHAAGGPPQVSALKPIHVDNSVKAVRAAQINSSLTYHNGSTLRCADCHIMHQSKQHPLDDDGLSGVFGSYPQNLLVGPKLLNKPDPVDLCLTCHDGQIGMPDVMGADANALAERSAGFFDLVGERNPRGHSLDRGLPVGSFELCTRCHFVGEFATASVTCIDCHNPHGNDRPRILQWASAPGGEPQFGLFEATGATGVQRYEAANIAYGTDNTFNLREVTNMCVDCHHVFSGESYTDPDGNGWHNRHPSYESERLAPNSIDQGAARFTTDPMHWEDGTGAGFGVTARLRWVASGATDFAAATVVDASTNGVFCLTCHKAHGGEHAFALRWDPSISVAGNGCDQCHNKTGL